MDPVSSRPQAAVVPPREVRSSAQIAERRNVIEDNHGGYEFRFADRAHDHRTRIDRTSVKQLHKIDPDKAASRRPINRQAARRDRARTVHEEDRRQSTLERGPKTGQAFAIGGVKQ